MKKTNIERVKEMSKALFDVMTFQEASDCVGLNGLIISHPYSNTGVYMTQDGVWKNLVEDKAAQEEYRKLIFGFIDKANTPIKIMLFVNKPYRLFWFKQISVFLSEKDFANIFGEIWVGSENPNGDINVSLDESIRFFKQANKKYLMNEDEYKIYSMLPDELTVYRGVSKGRNPDGLSYSLLEEKAVWFQQRYADKDNPGFLIQRKVKRENILAYFSRRGEAEIVLDVPALGGRND